ncbi:MAG: H-X9-DG-CTERM domain-containing protein [Candidatus Hydrogenedentales bacterium]
MDTVVTGGYLNIDLYNGLVGLMTDLGTNAATGGTIEQAAALVDADLPVGAKTAYRLREGIERFMVTDINNPAGSAQAQSELPVFFDNFSAEASNFNHVPGGGNVLYMDGHVEFLRYPADTYPRPPAVGKLRGRPLIQSATQVSMRRTGNGPPHSLQTSPHRSTAKGVCSRGPVLLADAPHRHGLLAPPPQGGANIVLSFAVKRREVCRKI